jgi:hypothetical protein
VAPARGAGRGARREVEILQRLLPTPHPRQRFEHHLLRERVRYVRRDDLAGGSVCAMGNLDARPTRQAANRKFFFDDPAKSSAALFRRVALSYHRRVIRTSWHPWRSVHSPEFEQSRGNREKFAADHRLSSEQKTFANAGIGASVLERWNCAANPQFCSAGFVGLAADFVRLAGDFVGVIAELFRCIVELFRTSADLCFPYSDSARRAADPDRSLRRLRTTHRGLVSVCRELRTTLRGLRSTFR